MGIPRKIFEKWIGRPLEQPKTEIKLQKSRYRSKSESAYATKLEAMARSGEILAWKYEAVKFFIGLWYVPDFMVIRPYLAETSDGYRYNIIEFHELKGRHRFREKGIVKFKAAQIMYPWFIWKLIEV